MKMNRRSFIGGSCAALFSVFSKKKITDSSTDTLIKNKKQKYATGGIVDKPFFDEERCLRMDIPAIPSPNFIVDVNSEQKVETGDLLCLGQNGMIKKFVGNERSNIIGKALSCKESNTFYGYTVECQVFNV